MSRVKITFTPSGDLVRYRCTCGHCQDVQEKPDSEQRHDVLILEGFQELP